MMRHVFALSLSLFFMMTGGLLGKASEPVNFNFQVLPILSDRCYFCHGTDAKHRKADLRLDVRSEALKVIKPGQPEASELYKRLLSTDPDEVMPPPESHLSVSPEEREILRRWITEGAEYRGHWAFQPIVSPAVPKTEAAAALKNDIDAFVMARLAKEGIALQPTAAPARLLRRLAFDLTGLPPSLEELDAIEADPKHDLQPFIKKYLSSPHFGERMAVDWLDVARYADTFGYQSDVAMNAWPYRDWVIKAFNENLPIDQFISWQLAGDLLPNATQEQRLATAFNRLHRQTNEGGSIEEEFRVEYVCDRVETYGLAFLGLTMQCAKCHDHKYDPVTMQDYYSLFAYFQNIDESGLYSHFTSAVPTPALGMTTAAKRSTKTVAAATLRQLAAELTLSKIDQRPAFETWKQGLGVAQELAIPGLLGHFPLDEIKDNKVANVANEKEPGSLLDEVKTEPGKVGSAIHLSGENNVNFSLGGKWSRDDAFSVALWLKTPDVKERAVIFHRSKAWTDAGSNGYELLIEKGKLSAALVHFWPGNAIRIVAKQPLVVNQWTHVVYSYDGSSQAKGLKLLINGAEAEIEIIRDALTRDINSGGEDRFTIGQRFRDRGFKDGLVDELRLYERALTRVEAAQLAGVNLKPSSEELYDYYLATVNEPYRQLRDQWQKARKALSKEEDSIREIMTMQEMASPKPAYVLFRGKYDERREEVTARPLSAFPKAPEGAPANRLGLAQWTISKENPLVARVWINRLWQSFFGRGFVSTPEDIGLQGALPSHPELLDFLAKRFIDSGWDFKELIEFIVSSQTYQQESTTTAEARAKDPENVLLGRGPSFRLSAEQLRDQAIVAAGLLEAKVGGASVDPDTTTRRSMYTFWRRTMPDVRMELFDMAKREVCTARRPQTNTPLQALTLLNEPRFLSFAEKIATEAAKQPSLDQSLTLIFRKLTSRKPSPKELTILRQLHAEHQTPEPAKGLLAVAQAVMNFDEALMKR